EIVELLVELTFRRVAGIVLAVLLGLRRAVLGRPFHALRHLVDVTEHRRGDRLRERGSDLDRTAEVTLLIRHAAGIVCGARGIAPVAAVEVLSRPRRGRTSEPCRDRDPKHSCDQKAENAFHRLPPFWPVRGQLPDERPLGDVTGMWCGRAR